MLLMGLVVLSGLAEAGCVVEDAWLSSSVPRAGAPVALLVMTPGYAPEAYDALVAALEGRHGRLAVQRLRCPLADQSVEAIVREAIPSAMAESGARALIGHGLGGTMAAMAVAEGHAAPEALALLGAPLAVDPLALHRWLAARPLPLPSDAVDLTVLSEVPWREAQGSAMRLLLGDPLPPLEAVSPAWLAEVQGWAAGGGLSVDLRSAAVPVWAGCGGLDNLAPAEWMRPMLPGDSFERYGYLRLEDSDPDSSELLRHEAALGDMARWLRAVLR